MNPGYAGRTELPQNIRNMSRIISIVQPNSEIITKVLLEKSGFDNSSVLAKKMVTVLNAMKENLSRQAQYDFGMRSIKTIAQAAAKLKFQNLSEDEDKIAVKALSHILYRLTD